MKPLKLVLATALALLSAATMAAIDVNKANQAELEGIKGIGPSMSTRILDARKTGAFKDWADMQSRVKGVRNGNATKFSADGLTVNGASYAGGSTVAATAKPRGMKETRPADAAAKKQ